MKADQDDGSPQTAQFNSRRTMVMGAQARRRVGRPSNSLERHCLRPGCEASFLARPSELARGGGRFCSAVCRDLTRRKPSVGADINNTELGPAVTEAVCPVPLRPRPPPPTALVCRSCGSTFRVYPYRTMPGRRARFCSRTCIVAEPRCTARTTPVSENDGCQQCGKLVVVRADQRSARAAAMRWCSIECTAAYFRTKEAMDLAR